MNMMQIFGDMGFVGWSVVIILLLLSVYSIGVMVDKFRTFRSARKESVRFLPQFVKSLKEGRLESAVEASRNHKRSHVAKVVSAGVMEFMNAEGEALRPGERVEAVERALDRATALTSAEMKKGLGGLATIGATAPFIGLFGTVMGIMNAFQGIATSGSGGIASVSAGIAEALITTAFGLFVAIPAVMAFNYFTAGLERFQVEMTNSSAELVDFFLKKIEGGRATR
jgi:biopolymer transport protein ExbB/biopolymer transport protein TolQ